MATTDRNELFRNYLKRLTVFTLIICLLSVLFVSFSPPGLASPYTLYLVGFFYLILVINKYITHRLRGNNPGRFVRTHMISSVIKLMLYLSIILFFVFRYPGDSLSFVISFFVVYLMFTAREVIEMSKSIGKKSELKQTKNIIE